MCVRILADVATGVNICWFERECVYVWGRLRGKYVNVVFVCVCVCVCVCRSVSVRVVYTATVPH